jgi:RHS repeat-associated protein
LHAAFSEIYDYDNLDRLTDVTRGNGFDQTWGQTAAYHTSYYYNVAWQVLESQDKYYAQVDALVEYVWSPGYIDSPIVVFRDGPFDDYTRYFTRDANHNITATIDASTGEVFQRFVYEAYGKAAAYDGAWSGSAFPLPDGPLYAGYFFDGESGLYHVRNRYYDPGMSTFVGRDPMGYGAGDGNLYRYVGNGPVGAVDPWGLAHLPGNARGEWVEGVRGNGVFEYADTPMNRERGIAGKRVVYKNQHIAPGGFPGEWYYGGNAEIATVPVERVLGTDSDFSAADAAMRAKLRDPSWRRPEGYTWNHSGQPGSGRMELVKTKYHRAVAHQGSARLPRAMLRRTGALLGRGAANALIIGDVYMTARDAAQAAGLVQADFVVGRERTYYFTCDDGSVFGLRLCNPGVQDQFVRVFLLALAADTRCCFASIA